MKMETTYLREIKESLEKRNFVEKFIVAFGILNFCPKSLRKRYQDAIEFAHINITPEQVFSTALLIPLLLIVVGFPLMLYLKLSTFSYIILLILAGSSFYYFYNYPLLKAKSFRMEATSEMMLAVIYIGVSMKTMPNLEKAIHFAATNLTGALGVDLKGILWDVYSGKYSSFDDALDEFLGKWKYENEEFVEAITIIKNAFSQAPGTVSKAVDEAVELMLSESKRKMEKSVMEMKTPLVVLNAFGILLPVLGMMFLPLTAAFIPEIFDLSMVVFIYNIMLPFFVFWFISEFLQKRPYTFHQPEFPKERFFKYDLIGLVVLISTLLISFFVGLFPIIIGREEKLLHSIFFVCGIGMSIAAYSFTISFFKLDFRNKVVNMERELGEFLFILGITLSKGMPIEDALEKSKKRVKVFAIREMVERITYNIKIFGMTFKNAVFDKSYGVVAIFPSKIIKAMMKAVVEVSQKGTFYLSQALVGISRYLRGMKRIEDFVTEQLSDIAMNMRLQAWLLVPLTCAIVVALMAIMAEMLLSIQGLYENLISTVSQMGTVGSIGEGALQSIFNFQKVVDPWIFQLILGIYMIEVVFILAYFDSKIEYGGEKVMRDFNVAKMLTIASLVYTALSLTTYFSLSSIARMIV
jgi:hypothetical protein